MTLSYVSRDSFTCLTWPIRTYEMNFTSLVYMHCDMTYWFVSHDPLICLAKTGKEEGATQGAQGRCLHQAQYLTRDQSGRAQTDRLGQTLIGSLLCPLCGAGGGDGSCCCRCTLIESHYIHLFLTFASWCLTRARESRWSLWLWVCMSIFSECLWGQWGLSVIAVFLFLMVL